MKTWAGHGMARGLGAAMLVVSSCAVAGAGYVGLDNDLGSIEVGKLADLAIIDGNPLADIRLSEKVDYVVLNGRLYNAATMNEVGNYTRKRKPFYWENNPGAELFDWHEKSKTHNCSCGLGID